MKNILVIKKNIDDLKNLLKKNSIDLPSRMLESTSSSNSKQSRSTKVKGHTRLVSEAAKG